MLKPTVDVSPTLQERFTGRGRVLFGFVPGIRVIAENEGGHPEDDHHYQDEGATT
jgi:hypothetical protein